MSDNLREGVLLPAARTLDDRRTAAESCSLDLGLTIPTLLDDLEDSTDRTYYALPDRLFLVDRDGRIAYLSAPGPFGFVVADLESAIERLLAAP